jgi:cytochrome c2
MGQVKYLFYACLILMISLTAYSFFNKLTAVQFVSSKNEIFDIDPNAQGETNLNSKGRQIFNQNCGSCHSLNKVLNGPALLGATERGPWAGDKEKFKRWLNNPAAFIPTSEYTIALQKEFNNQIMQSFPNLTREESDLIYDYLDNAITPASELP